MIELAKFQPEEIDEAIEGLDGLRDIIAPVLRRINGDGMGEQDVQQFIRQLTLAKHALIAMGGFLETGMKMVQASSNAPLTLEELREMDGEPVWIIPMRGSGGFETWMLVDAKYELCREAHGEMAVFENCGKTWLAYRRRLQGGGNPCT